MYRASRRTNRNYALVVGKYETVPVGQRLQLKVMKMETNTYNLERAELGDLVRRAEATISVVTLLDCLEDSTLWTDSCTIAECIEDVARALGWKHERLVRYMLEIPEEPEEVFGNSKEWGKDDFAYLFSQIIQGIEQEPSDNPGLFLPAFAARIASEVYESGATNQSGEAMLDNIVGLVSHFIQLVDGADEQVLHPRLRQTMDAIWEAASWVGNEKLDEAA